MRLARIDPRAAAGVVLFSLSLIMMLLPVWPVRGQTDCPGCARTAYLNSIVTNSGEPNFETMVKYRMWEALITPCFHFVAQGVSVPDEYIPVMGYGKRPPEYFFNVDYEEGLPGPVLSRLSIDMYFAGPPEEKVMSWTTEGTRPLQNFAGYHTNRMFEFFYGNGDPRTSVLRRSQPIDEKVLKDFEKRPTRCLIRPEKTTVAPGEKIEVVITGIENEKGERSREFNRLVVQAVEGEIEGGQPLETDRALRVFTVGREGIAFSYKAPDAGGAKEDTINVYNACDILPDSVVPLAHTRMKDKIASQRIAMGEAVTRAVVTNRIVTTAETGSSTRHGDTVSTTRESRRTELEVTVEASFELDAVSEDEDNGEIEETYTLKSWRISASSATHSSRLENEDRDAGPQVHFQGLAFRRVVTAKASGSASQVNEWTAEGSDLIIILDKRSGKAKTVILPMFPVSVSGIKTVETKTIYGDCTKFRETSSTETGPETIFFGGIGNSIGHPEEVLRQGRLEGQRVRGGDGIRNLSGEATIELPDLPPGEHSEYSCTWQLTRELPKKKIPESRPKVKTGG